MNAQVYAEKPQRSIHTFTGTFSAVSEGRDDWGAVYTGDMVTSQADALGDKDVESDIIWI